MRAAPGGTSTDPDDLAVSNRGCGRNLPCGSPRQRYFPTISRTFSASSFERANRSFAKIARTSSRWFGMRSPIFTALKGDIMGISMSSFTIGGTLSAGTRANSNAWEREYCCSGLSSPRAPFSFSRMTFSSARETNTSSMIPLLRPPQVLGPDHGLFDLAAEPHVDEERAAAPPDDGARHAVEAVVRPAALDARVDDDRHVFAVLEGLERPRDRGEPALAGAAAELLPRLLHDPLRGLHHRLTGRRGRPRRRARSPRRPPPAVPQGTARSVRGPRGSTP